jgi:DNA-binding MarR family transcriptional regulator
VWCVQARAKSRGTLDNCSKQLIYPVTLGLRQPRHIDELLNYRLLRLYAVSGAPVIRLLEGRYGISRREWRLLALLALHGELSPSGLAEKAHLDRPRATRGVQVLVDKQLARRVPLPGDARRAMVSLTAAGQQLYDELFPQIAAINQQVVSALGDEAVAALDAALAQLTTQAEAVNQQVLRDLRADRQAGAAAKPRRWPLVD